MSTQFKKMTRMGIGLVLTLTPSLFAQAGENCAGALDLKAVLVCVRENHPEIRRARLENSQSAKREDVAKQRPNPELDVQSAVVSLTKDADLGSEFSLLHTVELGGKRSGRIDRARSEYSVSQADLQRVQEAAVLKTILALHRLRQIDEEAGVLNETVATFERQLKSLRSRPALSPEQDVSMSVFSLAKEDASMKRSQLLVERNGLIREIQLAIGGSASYTAAWLPDEPKTWPDLKASGSLDLSPDGKKAKAEVSLAEADLGLAQAEAWPDLKVGPFFQSDLTQGERSWGLGFQVSVPLPLLNMNGGGKAFAEAGLARAEESARLVRSELDVERTQSLSEYQATVEQLNKSRFHEEYESRHKKVESLFARGVLGSAMVIEAHRQIMEVQKTSHELELKALNALYRIRILDGESVRFEL